MAKYKNVFTLEESLSHSFYQLPKELFQNDRYKNMSLTAKVLYALLLDRKELSRSNNWADEYGQIYLIYTRENVAECLNLSLKTVGNAFKELSDNELIIEERQGLNKPNKIYVCRIKYGQVKNTSQEKHNLPSNDTYPNDTENLKNNNVISKMTQTVFLENKDEVMQALPYDQHHAELILYYAEAYKRHFGKSHPRISTKQLNRISTRIDVLMSRNYATFEEVSEVIDEYFASYNVGDGNINRLFNGTKDWEGLVENIYQTLH